MWCGAHLDPGVAVVSGGAPGVDQAFAVEAGQLGPPALQTHHRVTDRRRRDLGLGDAAALEAEQGNTTCGNQSGNTKTGGQRQLFTVRGNQQNQATITGTVNLTPAQVSHLCLTPGTFMDQ